MACHYVATSGRDNRIAPADAAIAQRFNTADISGDGQVTSLDGLMILQMMEVPT